jgi:NAD(P)-dependent dehydrogenase (short-subunit alcohol dehydrogenase family)
MAGLLEGKCAVVTGAASGIGRASAILFAAEGARVLAADVSDAVQQTAADIEGAGGTTIAMLVDVADPSQVDAMISRAISELGGLDAVYANAGISNGMPALFDESLDDFRRVLAVNLLGTFSTVRRAAAVMVKQRSGSIIMTASVAGLRAHAGSIAYSASKAGVISLAQTIASQLRGTGVRINAICPGLIETGMTRPIFDYAKSRGTERRLGQLNPTTRHGVPDEIAQMAAFLASDRSSYVNGQAIPVDGGLSCGHPFVLPKI